MKTRPAPLPRSRSAARRPPPRGPRTLVVVLGGVLAALVVFVAAVLLRSGATLEPDASALAAVHVETFGGSLVSAHASRGGRPLPLYVAHGKITPATPVRPGERIDVDVVVRRPALLGWAIGHESRERLSIRAPEAKPTASWFKVSAGAPVRVRFDRSIVRAAYLGRTHRLATPGREVTVGRLGPAGSVAIATAPRRWERVGAPARVSWFPRTGGTVAVASPDPGGQASPAQPLRLTFSSAVGNARPVLSPHVPGRWHKADSHTLVFVPTGFGAGFGSTIHARLPQTVSLAGPGGRGLTRTNTVTWKVPPGSTRRLHQILAQEGYLPVRWHPTGAPVARTARAQVAAAVNPPAGRFTWRYPNTPPELKGLWNADKASGITKGAVMKFQTTHGLDVDGLAGPRLWQALIKSAMAGERFHGSGYSYVYVHRDASPQTMTLWHNGHTVIQSPSNTGVASAPTALGTFQVFEHLPVTTMSGTNPDGSHYNDPGIKWVSYFNGGDALHAFNRASFGSPQSVGCVELPEAAAAKIFPYTTIGTVVTIEN